MLSVSMVTKANLQIFIATLLFAGVPASAAEELPVINRIFANVPDICSTGYAYQSFNGGTCSRSYPQQSLDGTSGLGWSFTGPVQLLNEGAGLTNQDTAFDPPAFTGLPFSQAAFLQGHSEVFQPIHGFIEGIAYRLYFYLGSRYRGDSSDGNQTVAVLIDDQVIGSWSLASYTPFTLQTRLFEVVRSGPHVLKFVGLAAGDHTAFFSGVSIKAAAE